MHEEVIQLFHVGEVANCFPKWDIDQNAYLDTKAKTVTSNISAVDHWTNFPHMETLEHTLVISEILTVVFCQARTIPTRWMSI